MACPSPKLYGLREGQSVPARAALSCWLRDMWQAAQEKTPLAAKRARGRADIIHTPDSRVPPRPSAVLLPTIPTRAFRWLPVVINRQAAAELSN